MCEPIKFIAQVRDTKHDETTTRGGSFTLVNERTRSFAFLCYNFEWIFRRKRTRDDDEKENYAQFKVSVEFRQNVLYFYQRNVELVLEFKDK